MMEYVKQQLPAGDLTSPLKKSVEVEHRLVIADAPDFSLNDKSHVPLATCPPPSLYGEAVNRIDCNHGIFPLAAHAPDYSPLYARLQNSERPAPFMRLHQSSDVAPAYRVIETQWPAPSFVESLQSRGIYMTRTYSVTPDSVVARSGEGPSFGAHEAFPWQCGAAPGHPPPSPSSAEATCLSNGTRRSRGASASIVGVSDSAADAFSVGISPLSPKIRESIEQPLEQLWASNVALGKDSSEQHLNPSRDEGFEDLRAAMRGSVEDDSQSKRKEALPKFNAGEILQHSSRFGGPRPSAPEQAGSVIPTRKSVNEADTSEPTDIEGWKALCREERESKKVLENRIQTQASSLRQLQQDLDKQIARSTALVRSQAQSQNEAEESRRELQNFKHSLRGRKDGSSVDNVVSIHFNQPREQALENALQETLTELETARQQNASLRFLLQNASQENCDKQLNNEVKQLRQQHLTASTLLSRWGHFAAGLQRILDDEHLQSEKKIEELRMEIQQVVRKGISKYEPQKAEPSIHAETDLDQHPQSPSCQNSTRAEVAMPSANTFLKACPAARGEVQCALRGSLLKKKKTPTGIIGAGRVGTESSGDYDNSPRSVMDRIKKYEATHKEPGREGAEGLVKGPQE